MSTIFHLLKPRVLSPLHSRSEVKITPLACENDHYLIRCFILSNVIIMLFLQVPLYLIFLFMNYVFTHSILFSDSYI